MYKYVPVRPHGMMCYIGIFGQCMQWEGWASTNCNTLQTEGETGHGRQIVSSLHVSCCNEEAVQNVNVVILTGLGGAEKVEKLSMRSPSDSIRALIGSSNGTATTM